MKILVVGVDCPAPESFFGDERLVNFRQLAAAGCYGRLGSAEPGSVKAWMCEFTELISSLPGGNDPAGRSALQVVEWSTEPSANRSRTALQAPPRDACLDATADPWKALDDKLAGLLEAASDQAVILVLAGQEHGDATGEDVSAGGQAGVFILAAANNPLSGEIQGATIDCLAPTLLELAGYAIPATIPARSLVAGMNLSPRADDILADSEQMVRDRLSGLGYL